MRLRTTARHISCVGALLLAACGPPKLAGEPGSEDATELGGGSDDAAQTDPPSSSSSSESESTGDGDDTSTSGGSLSFVPETDLVTIGCECDPFAQDCPEGEKCVAASAVGETWEYNKCVPVTGSQAAGQACSYGGLMEATDDCDAESACWDLEEFAGEWVGTCRAFCGGTADNPICAEDHACLVASEGSVTLCLHSCDPLLQDCAEGSACVWGANTGVFVCTASLLELGAGSPCASIMECSPGMICLDAALLPSCEGDDCCTSYCDLSLLDADCEAQPGSVCAPFFDEPIPPGAETLGVCLSP